MYYTRLGKGRKDGGCRLTYQPFGAPTSVHENTPAEAVEKPSVSPEAYRRSSLEADNTPLYTAPQRESLQSHSQDETMRYSESAQKTHDLDDKFMLDSLNDQLHTSQRMSINPGFKIIQEPRKTEIIEEATLDQSSFMTALESAITHFESKSMIQKEKLHLKPSPNSFAFSPNTNAFTSPDNIQGEIEESTTDSDKLKKEYNSLFVKYNELKANNKKLMNDYAVLRSQLEEMKSQKASYEIEMRQLLQQVQDGELRLLQATELYTREKIEKENNSLAFKRILETMGSAKSIKRSLGPVASSAYHSPHATLGEHELEEEILEEPEEITLQQKYFL